MPNYEYKCTQDGSTFEIWQEVGADAPPCPTCGAPTKKVFQPPRVIFKGSGFYLTDLRAEQGEIGRLGFTEPISLGKLYSEPVCGGFDSLHE